MKSYEEKRGSNSKKWKTHSKNKKVFIIMAFL